MASVTLTFPANNGANAGYNTGSQLRAFAKKLLEAASQLPDNVPTGADVTLVVDNTVVSNSPGFFTLAGGNLAASVTKRI